MYKDSDFKIKGYRNHSSNLYVTLHKRNKTLSKQRRVSWRLDLASVVLVKVRCKCQDLHEYCCIEYFAVVL